MHEESSLKKTLLNIQSEQKLDQLEQFRDQDKWNELAESDLDLLANLFIKKGMLDVNKNREIGLDEFHTALKITGYSHETYLKIAKAWMHLSEWDEADLAIQEGLKRAPEHLESLIEAATISLNRGSQERKEEHLIESLERFNKALKIHPQLSTEGFYRWGKACFILARLSQEPCDFLTAIEKFKMAENLGSNDKHLFFDHALALADLASYVSRVEHIHESLLYLLKAVESDPHFYEGWLHLGGTYKYLYEQGEKDEYYERAESAFITTARINPHSKFLWLTWGQMLLSEGKYKRNNDILNLALEKFERADALYPNDRDIECFLADTLMVLGLHEERYEMIKEAKTKIEEILEARPDDAAVLFLYGTCLLHTGKYFSDEKMIRQSFSYYEKACNLNPNDPNIWQSLGIAHYTLGELSLDPILLEKSCTLFENALKVYKTPNSETLNNWGVALMKLSEINQNLEIVTVAAEKFEQAIAYHQSHRRDGAADPEWFYNYGCALDYLGDFYQDPSYYERAVQILSHVITQYPTYTQARYNLAVALTHLGDATGEVECIDQALHHFDELVKEDYEDETVLSDYGLALLTLGDIHIQSHSFNQAKKYFEDAETRLLQGAANGSKSAFFWLACLYSLNLNYPESIHFLEKARDHDSLPTKEELEAEVWLDGVRSTSSYTEFLKTIN